MEATRIILAGYAWGVAASDLLTAVAMFGVTTASLLDPDAVLAPASPGGLPPGAAALREALPPFLASRVGGAAGPGLAVPPSESEAFYFRARLLLADDFAEAVLIHDAFARRLDGAQGDLAEVAAWCRGVGLRLEALLDLTRRRETAAEEAIIAGLNPFRNPSRRLSNLPAEAFTDGLVRFKRCLYDGLRGRLLRYDPDAPGGPGYVTRQGLRVKAPELLTDAQASRLRALGVTRAPPEPPRWILTDAIRIHPAPKAEKDRVSPLLYTLAANLVSVLDGYVEVDPEFDGPRVELAGPRVEFAGGK